MPKRRVNGAVVESGAPRAMTFARLHRGLPDEAPWFFRVALRSRAFLIVTLAVTALFAIIAASNPEWLLRFDQPASDWVRGGGEQLSLTKLVTQLGSPNLAMAVGLVGVALLWRRCRASAVTLGVLIAAALSVDILLKLVVDRARPPNPAVDTALGSFPSGHVIHAVVIFGLVPLLLWTVTNRRVFLRLGFVLFAVVLVSVAVSRVRLGAHWPSDVITSFFIGASLLLAGERILTSTWAADRCVSLGHHPTQPTQHD
ncbi:MAG: phosphatase PAP2 family protein [Actinomycetota bacterium]|nr:phosphatase PAP2 family protein [Actinomycetota bacterium]